MNPNLDDGGELIHESSLGTPHKNLRDRISEISEKLADESSLPMGLRTRLAEELSALLTQSGEPGTQVEEMAEKIHTMALVAYAYGESALQSDTLKKVRSLDLEMEPIRQRSGIQPLKEFDFGELEVQLQRAG